MLIIQLQRCVKDNVAFAGSAIKDSVERSSVRVNKLINHNAVCYTTVPATPDMFKTIMHQEGPFGHLSPHVWT